MNDIPSNIKHDTDIHLLLERGREIRVRHGSHNWHAVYWGWDDGEDLVASRDGDRGKWRFVRIDLRAIGQNLSVGELLPRSEIQKIERDIVETMGGDEAAPKPPPAAATAAPAEPESKAEAKAQAEAEVKPDGAKRRKRKGKRKSK